MHQLIVVGSGIKSVSHITEETKKIIRRADKVLYLVNEELLKTWIKRESILSESLDSIYYSTTKRIDAYNAITNYIVAEYSKFNILCVVFYGHPAVFADSALKAVKRIKLDGGHAVILPAISAMDCLYSDLNIDPGKTGCFSIEATELLIYERKIDIYSHLLLWQAANLGTHDTSYTTKLNILHDYLLEYYTEDHPVCVYEAAQLPTQSPRIEWIKLHKLINASINPISTLYFPPDYNKKLSEKYLTLLNMDLRDFRLSAQTDTSSE